MDQVSIRPVRAADIVAAQLTSYTSLREAGRSYGWEMPALDDDRAERGRRRLAHLLTHDPDGAYVADVDGEVVGVAFATRRGPLWFLSLLAVAAGMQARGIGRRLLDAAAATRGPAAAICASNDPKALRRYHRLGLDLLPAYEAKGVLDRSLLPEIRGVRPGSYADDRDLVEHVAIAQRGAPHGPDLDFFAAMDLPLFVTDGAAGRGYVVGGLAGPEVLAATTPTAARSLLWTALAEAPEPERHVSWVTHAQQWALDVAGDARLSLRPSGSVCRTSAVGPMSPYLPSGGLG